MMFETQRKKITTTHMRISFAFTSPIGKLSCWVYVSDNNLISSFQFTYKVAIYIYKVKKVRKATHFLSSAYILNHYINSGESFDP